MYALMVGTHIAFAIGAVILGIFVLSMTKGTPRHKLMGRIWVGMMTLVAIGSFSLRDLNHGEFSAIHALSAFTLLSMVYAIIMIRRGNRRAHFLAMIGCFIGAVIAGVFTLNPERLIGSFFFSS